MKRQLEESAVKKGTAVMKMNLIKNGVQDNNNLAKERNSKR